MIRKIKRSNDFLLEQEAGAPPPPSGDPSAQAPSAGPEGTKFEAPKDVILAAPEVGDSFIEKDASLDQIVDKYLMKYEQESVPLESNEKEEESSSKKIDEEFKYNKLNYYIFEQDAGLPPLPPAGDLGAPLPGAASTSTPAKTEPVPKINLRKFAQGVARLVYNYQSLINPKRIILNRAQTYIEKNYSTRLAKELMGILERDFNLSSKTNAQKEDEAPSAPRAGRAGPEGGGGGGGA